MASAVMSFTYSSIGLGLGISKVVENGKIKGSLKGISIGKLLTRLQSQQEVGTGSGSGGGGDDEPCNDEDVGEDEDADGDEDS
nr:amino acid permease 3-like [Tanacetum cinerariifolium]